VRVKKKRKGKKDKMSDIELGGGKSSPIQQSMNLKVEIGGGHNSKFGRKNLMVQRGTIGKAGELQKEL